VLTISRRLRDLADRARTGRLRVDEMNEPTFTISNLGMHEVSRFTAILNPPRWRFSQPERPSNERSSLTV